MEKDIESGKTTVTLSDDVYKKLNMLKAKFSAKKGIALSWNDTFELLLYNEHKKNELIGWLYTIGIFIAVTVVLMFPVYLGSPFQAIAMIPVFLLIGFIVAYFTAYVLTPWTLREAKPFENAPKPMLKSLEDLSKKAELKQTPKLMLMETPEINAMAYMSMSDSRVCVTKGLMDAHQGGKIGEDELNAIIGHEIGHIKNRDCLKGALVLSWVSIFDAIGALFIYLGRLINRVSREKEGSTQIIMGLFGLFFTFGGFFYRTIAKIASALSFHLSRKMEYLADELSAELTSPHKMDSVLQKISILNNELVAEEIAALPYSDRWQLQPYNPSKIDRLFDTHPPTEERSAALRRIGEFL